MMSKIEKEKLLKDFKEENWLILEKERHFLDYEVLEACFNRLPSDKHSVFEVVCRSSEEYLLSIYLAPNNEIVNFPLDTEIVRKISCRFIPTQFKSGFVGENLKLEGCKVLAEEEKMEIRSILERENRDWLRQKFQELDAAWITVVDGEVKTHSSDIDQYPNELDILKFCGDNEGKLPFIFVNPRILMIEEGSSCWSKTVYPDDYYPTITIQMDSPCLTKSQNFIADFDTGAIEIYIDMGRLISEGVTTSPYSGDLPMKSEHLGREFWYYIRNFSVGIVPDKGTIKKTNFSVVCVRNWGISPFVEINESRGALVGRRLFLKLNTIMLLNFGKRKIEILG
ncbi:MAG: hypothetical protein QME42_03505 [bacterium]|nr:hypothetical protein [bacterium]